MRILLILSLFFSKIIYSQNIDQEYNYAKQEFNKANYETSIKSLNRVLFFDTNQINKLNYLLLLAQAYEKKKYYKGAIECFTNAYKISIIDSISNYILLKKAENNLLDNNPNLALQDFYFCTDSTSLLNEKNYYLIGSFIFFKLKEYNLSKYYFLMLDNNNHKKEIESAFNNIIKTNNLTVKKARILSFILPGMGQLYAKDYKNAINSLLLNTFFISLYIYVGINFGPLDALISISPWFRRYYIGGVNNAERSIIKRKLKKEKIYYNELLQIIK